MCNTGEIAYCLQEGEEATLCDPGPAALISEWSSVAQRIAEPAVDMVTLGAARFHVEQVHGCTVVTNQNIGTVSRPAGKDTDLGDGSSPRNAFPMYRRQCVAINSVRSSHSLHIRR